jgi:hypothetical protein
MAQRDLKKRRGLFAACLYVESMLECFEDLKFLLVFTPYEEQITEGRSKRIFYLPKAQKRSIGRRLAAPKALERWALIFHVHRKSITKRISEIEQETPNLGRIIAFVKRF